MQITQIDGISGSNITTQPAWGDAYDLAAEREAQAEALLADLTPRRIGRPSGSPITCADAAIAPVGPDGKIIRKHRNSHKKAVDRWRALVYLLQVANNLNASTEARAQAHARIARLTRWHLDTAADRVRQAQRRERRKALLAKLKRERAEYVSFNRAVRMADLRPRTLYNQQAAGRLTIVHRNGQVMVAVADLRTYLTYKVAA